MTIRTIDTRIYFESKSLQLHGLSIAKAAQQAVMENFEGVVPDIELPGSLTDTTSREISVMFAIPERRGFVNLSVFDIDGLLQLDLSVNPFPKGADLAVRWAALKACTETLIHQLEPQLALASLNNKHLTLVTARPKAVSYWMWFRTGNEVTDTMVALQDALPETALHSGALYQAPWVGDETTKDRLRAVAERLNLPCVLPTS